jgi:Ribosomal L27 protein
VIDKITTQFYQYEYTYTELAHRNQVSTVLQYRANSSSPLTAIMGGFLLLQTAFRGGLFASRSAISATSALATWRLHIPFVDAHSAENCDVICDERRLGGIRGAKKKAAGSTTNGRESPGRRLGIKVWCDKFARTFEFLIQSIGTTDELALTLYFINTSFYRRREYHCAATG